MPHHLPRDLGPVLWLIPAAIAATLTAWAIGGITLP